MRAVLWIMIVASSSLAQATNRVPIIEYKSDYLCFGEDPQGFHDDEGFAITLPQNSEEEVLFVLSKSHLLNIRLTAKVKAKRIL